jgi:hypothetical protein
LTQLTKSELKTKSQIEKINGIYVFYEADKPLYVGRTNKNRMRSRIMEHSAPYSNQNSATFAFRLAIEDIGDIKLSKIDSKHEKFLAAKERVSKMKIRCIEIDDPIIQTIFEPYVAVKLETIGKYNHFTTH